jgi:hypothetical protein
MRLNGTVVYVGCYDGYRINNSSSSLRNITLECTKTGSWNTTFTACQREYLNISRGCSFTVTLNCCYRQYDSAYQSSDAKIRTFHGEVGSLLSELMQVAAAGMNYRFIATITEWLREDQVSKIYNALTMQFYDVRTSVNAHCIDCETTI